MAVMEELNVVPIEKVIEERQLSLRGHVHRMNEEKLAKEIFEVRQTAEQRDRNWREAGTLAQNREAWKRRIRHNQNP